MNITVVLTTFGRSQELLEEAVYGFLLQEHPDKKLLIVNIHPTPVIFDHPDVKIYNIKPFEYYGQQMHYALTQIRTPLWCVFDSDDLILPWHLKNLYTNYLLHEKMEYHPFQMGHRKRWFYFNNELEGLVKYNWTCCVYDILSGYKLDKVRDVAKCWEPDLAIYKLDFFRVHGWFDDTIPGNITRKGMGWQITKDLDSSSKITCSDIVKEMPGYEGVLQPHWRKDYVKEVKDYWRQNYVSKSKCTTQNNRRPGDEGERERRSRRCYS